MSAHGTEPNTEPLLFPDPVIEAYMKDVDRTLIRAKLRLTVEQRLDEFAGFMNSVYEFRGAALPDKTGLWDEYGRGNA